MQSAQWSGARRTRFAWKELSGGWTFSRSLRATVAAWLPRRPASTSIVTSIGLSSLGHRQTQQWASSGICFDRSRMALMWPRSLPPDVLDNPLRSTEISVYRALERMLDASWQVFYSRPWLGMTSRGEEKDGECDFVVAQAEHGLLCLEVKGGAVAWDPATSQWTSRDRWGIVHRIKDPVAQARSAKHEILKKL